MRLLPLDVTDESDSAGLRDARETEGREPRRRKRKKEPGEGQLSLSSPALPLLLQELLFTHVLLVVWIVQTLSFWESCSPGSLVHLELVKSDGPVLGFVELIFFLNV